MDSDQYLVERILARDLRAFQVLVERYQRLVSHIVFRMIANKTDQEEICQEVFIKVYENLAQFKFQSQFSTWIGKIAYNSAVNYLKKNKIPIFQNDDAEETRDSLEISSSESIWGEAFERPDDLLVSRDITEIVQNEIQRLPAHYRTIITLYHNDELSYQEIGDILNLPVGTVKSYLFRARKQLKEQLLAKYELEDLRQ